MRCPSLIHAERGEVPPEATVRGEFDSSTLNDRPPVRTAFCPRCAAGLGIAGFFTADPIYPSGDHVGR